MQLFRLSRKYQVAGLSSNHHYA